jgi:hypothetical protein
VFRNEAEGFIWEGSPNYVRSILLKKTVMVNEEGTSAQQLLTVTVKHVGEWIQRRQRQFRTFGRSKQEVGQSRTPRADCFELVELENGR